MRVALGIEGPAFKAAAVDVGKEDDKTAASEPRVGDGGRERGFALGFRVGCLEGREGAAQRSAFTSARLDDHTHFKASFHSCTLRTASS